MTKTRYTSDYICNQFKEQKKEAYENWLKEAIEKLEKLKVSCRNMSNRALNGRVFEQTIKRYLIEELEASGIRNVPELITVQYPLKYELEGKTKTAKIDLKVEDKILIEIKGFGYLYGPSYEEKYKAIKKSANNKKYTYLYLTKDKENLIYIEKAIKLFEGKNCFFLFDEKEDNWQKFVKRVYSILTEVS